MSRRLADVPDRRSWSDPSLIFSDTQRVDLFDDPRWETGSSAERDPESRPSLRRAASRIIPFRPKRGRHSQRRH